MAANAEDILAAAAPEELVKKVGATSVIWEWFGFRVSDTKQEDIICKVCRASVTARQGNTSNLFYHLRTKHVVEYEASQRRQRDIGGKRAHPSEEIGKTKAKQQSIAQAFSKGTPYDRKNKRWIDITRSITTHLCRDMVPFQVVERQGFKDMVKTLDQRYDIPSRKYFAEVEMPHLHEEVRGRVEQELRQVKHYATTTDLWSSRTMDPYLSLTVHYITDEWKLHSKCLQTSYFPDDHTGTLIAQGLREALESWGLDERLQACITTDNGANVVKATDLNDWTRLQCFGHRLHLAIGKVIFLVCLKYEAITVMKKVKLTNDKLNINISYVMPNISFIFS